MRRIIEKSEVRKKLNIFSTSDKDQLLTTIEMLPELYRELIKLFLDVVGNMYVKKTITASGS